MCLEQIYCTSVIPICWILHHGISIPLVAIYEGIRRRAGMDTTDSFSGIPLGRIESFRSFSAPNLASFLQVLSVIRGLIGALITRERNATQKPMFS